MVGRHHGRAARQRLHQHEPVGLGLDRGEREDVEVGHHVGDVVAGVQEPRARGRGDAAAEGFGVLGLPLHGCAHDHEAGVGPLRAHPRVRVDEDVESLERVEPRHCPDHGSVVGDLDPRAERAGSRRREGSGLEVLVEDEYVRRIELRGDCVRHRDHPHREVPAQEPLDEERGARLDDDLPRVHDVRSPHEPRHRPAVPGVQRVGVHDVDVEPACEPGEAHHGDRPGRAVRRPLAATVAGRDPTHRDLVDGRARVGEVGRERRWSGQGDVEVELVAWEAPHESEERLVRPAALGDRLHGEDPDGAGCRQRRTAAPRGAGWHRALHGGIGEATPGPRGRRDRVHRSPRAVRRRPGAPRRTSSSVSSR